MTAQEARAKIEQQIAFEKAEKIRISDLENEKQILKAQEIMASFDVELQKAVAKSKFGFNLARLSYADYNNSYPYNELSLNSCSPWVRLVFREIAQKEGFKAELVFGHDGVGMESWFDIHVSF